MYWCVGHCKRACTCVLMYACMSPCVLNICVMDPNTSIGIFLWIRRHVRSCSLNITHFFVKRRCRFVGVGFMTLSCMHVYQSALMASIILFHPPTELAENNEFWPGALEACGLLREPPPPPDRYHHCPHHPPPHQPNRDAWLHVLVYHIAALPSALLPQRLAHVCPASTCFQPCE